MNDDLKARLLHCSENTKDEYLHELTGRAATAITDLEALVGELGEALGRLCREADELDRVGLADAFDRADATLAKLEKARGKDQDHD